MEDPFTPGANFSDYSRDWFYGAFFEPDKPSKETWIKDIIVLRRFDYLLFKPITREMMRPYYPSSSKDSTLAQELMLLVLMLG